ncbi:MAG: GGDEF domain-containing protein [Lachnospiraceae bacterium]|nr:GGDEF domain-containing protein [Lachnospiraceae bacterium]
MEIVKKILRYLGIYRNSYEVVKLINRQNLKMGFPVLIIVGSMTLVRIIITIYKLSIFALEYGTVDIYEFQGLFIYAFVVVMSALMLYCELKVRNVRDRNENFISIVVYLFIISLMCYGFQISVTYMEKVYPFGAFIVSCIWSFLLFNVKPYFAVGSSFIFNECIRLAALRHGIKMDFKTSILIMISLWVVSLVRYNISLDNARLIIEDKRLNEKLHGMNERLNQISATDELTGVKNRNGLRNDFDNYVGKKLFVMFCDIDNFKYINDNFGHPVGDRVIANYAETLVMIYGLDGVYRYGGDEFLVIKEYSKETFDIYKKRFRILFKRFCVPESTHLVTTSGGFFIDQCDSAKKLRDMFKKADDNLYRAKENGKNRVIGNGD